MKNLITLCLGLLMAASTYATDNPAKKKMDREAIRGMQGCHKVTFNFAETYSPNRDYTYYDRYYSEGIEYVFALVDEENFISLQHLLVMNDTLIIKHWRQDWVYEEPTLLSYDRDKVWRKHSATPAEVKGTWTQKVYQVDDSPRYELRGTWVHANGEHYWEGTGDSPLPRREFTKRSDYNVLKRRNRIQLDGNGGWYMEQDNQKILRTDVGDELICNEKGMEAHTAGQYNCQPAIDWWQANQRYWDTVREVWAAVFADHEVLAMLGKVDDVLLWQRLFEAGDQVREGEAALDTKHIRALIEKHIKTDMN